MIKELTNITQNETAIINNIASPLVMDDGEVFDVYIGISATSLCSVRLLISDDNYDTYGTCNLEELTSQANMYALHLSLSGYTYSGSKPEYRTANIVMSAYTCGELSGETTITINQRGCAEDVYYTVTFYTGQSTTPNPQTVRSGSVVVEPQAPEHDLPSMMFDAWYTKYGGGGDRYDFSTPVYSNKTLYANFVIRPMVGFEIVPFGDNEHWSLSNIESQYIGLYDESSQEITPVTIGGIRQQTNNSLKFEWHGVQNWLDNEGNIVDITNQNQAYGYWCNRSGGMNGYQRSSVYLGDETALAFGISQDNGVYEPYGFQIKEQISQENTRVTIVPGIKTKYLTDGQITRQTNYAVYIRMQMNYETQLVPLVTYKKFTATVSSTTKCNISIDGIQNGSKQFNDNSVVTGITTSMVNPTANTLVGYWVEPDNGTAYRANLNETITINSDDITISPICSAKTAAIRFDMMGFGSNGFGIGLINTSTQEITELSISDVRKQSGNNLVYEWGNVAGRIDESGNVSYIDNPYYRYNGSTAYSRTGSGTYGNDIYFAFGLSEAEDRYEPYAFYISETIDDKERRTTILTPIGYANFVSDVSHIKKTSVGIHGKMKLLYPTNIKCLVKTKENGFIRFDMGGHGNQVANQVIHYGNTVTRPVNPTESGYTFRGWYTDSALTTEYDFTSTVNSNLTLYAKWE